LNSTSPFTKPKPKTIVITRDYLDFCSGLGEFIALICWLQLQEFTLYLCLNNDQSLNNGQKNDFLRIPDSTHNGFLEHFVISQKERLSRFTSEDYVTLAALGIPRDHLCIANTSLIENIQSCFYATASFAPLIFAIHSSSIAKRAKTLSGPL